MNAHDATRVVRDELSGTDTVEGLASVTYDAFARGHGKEPEWQARAVALVALALAKYKRANPAKRPTMIAMVVRRGLTAKQRAEQGIARWRVKDVYCLFCGELIEKGAEQVTQDALMRAVPCALQYLAGVTIAVKPGTRGDPREQERLDIGPLFGGTP